MQTLNMSRKIKRCENSSKDGGYIVQAQRWTLIEPYSGKYPVWRIELRSLSAILLFYDAY